MGTKNNTVELLSIPKTSGDLWNEMHRDSNLWKLILNFRPNSEYVFRLLGPFVQGERLYIPSSPL